MTADAEDPTGVEVVAPETETESDEARAPGGAASRRVLRAIGRHWLTVILVALIAVSGATAGTLYFSTYRPDEAVSHPVADRVLDAARQGTVAILSYSPQTLDRDFAAAKAHLTGDFLAYYTRFTEQIVTPAARQKAVKTSATVVREAISQLRPTDAVVLVFIDQTTTSSSKRDPVATASTVEVHLTKSDGRWLISAFDPV